MFYEVHQRGYNGGSNAVLERLSGFISAQMTVNFTASWMLVAQWDRVHPYPHGAVEGGTSEQYGNFLESVSLTVHNVMLKYHVPYFTKNRKIHFKL